MINNELEQYNEELAQRLQIVALNKIDMLPDEEEIKRVSAELNKMGYETYPISAATKKGIKELIYRVAEILDELPIPETPVEEKVVIRPDFTEEKDIEIKRLDADLYEVTGRLVEETMQKTDFNNEAAVKRMLRVLQHHGLYDILKEHNLRDGDTVQIGPMSFEYLE